MTPEQKAREKIDAMLLAAGWAIQDYRQYDPGAAQGIALREVLLTSGKCDYLLLVDRKPVGVIEAKKSGTLLSGVAEQSKHYGDREQKKRLKTGTLFGIELVDSVARLCCMNLLLHGIGGSEADSPSTNHVPVTVKDALTVVLVLRPPRPRSELL